jgi:proteasome lid subunit RPN8/RPN11
MTDRLPSASSSSAVSPVAQSPVAEWPGGDEPTPPGLAAGLVLGRRDWTLMVTHCLRAHPEEGCGLLAGDAVGGIVRQCFPTTNAARSARLYTVDSRDLLRADRAAEASGWTIIGVFHSHTHTDAYPSATDIAQAPDPSWHYVLVSLRDTHPAVRSYRIVDGVVTEEPVHVLADVPA